MKKVLISTLLTLECFANLTHIHQFEADFQQNIVDDKNKTISYYGHIKASAPHYALWNYTKPIVKSIYIMDNRVVVVEPELEQAIFKTMDDDFNFFNMIKNAKKIKKDLYQARFRDKVFMIRTKKDTIDSITYKDEFDNNITIKFSNSSINKTIPSKDFEPDIPNDYDLIQE